MGGFQLDSVLLTLWIFFSISSLNVCFSFTLSHIRWICWELICCPSCVFFCIHHPMSYTCHFPISSPAACLTHL